MDTLNAAGRTHAVSDPAADRSKRKRSMKVFFSIVDWLSDKMKMVGAACLMGMTLLTCVDVVGRFFRRPVLGSVELVGFMATLTVVMALPYTHRLRGHIGVEMLVLMLPERKQDIVDLCTSFLSLLLFTVVTWRMVAYAGTMKRSGEVSMTLEIPEYILIYTTAFCFLVFVLAIVQDIVTIIQRLKEHK